MGGINNDGKMLNLNFKKEEQMKPKASKRNNKEQKSIKWKAEKSTGKKKSMKSNVVL